MTRRGIVIINATYTAPAVLDQVRRLEEEFSARGIELKCVRNNSLPVWLKEGEVRRNLPACDFVLYLDKDKHIARMLERTGLRLFNSAAAIEVCDDKLLTAIALSGKGIPMPDTISSPLCYRGEYQPQFLDSVAERLGFPVVVKECFGSLGKQVYLAQNMVELREYQQKLKALPHLYQRFVKSSAGQDARLILVGGKTVAAMRRVSNGDFRSNIELGGHGEAFEPPQAFRELAERAASLLALDYCGVDLLFGENGEALLCEVNSNAFFRGIETVSGINVGARYAEHVIDCIYGNDH